MLIRKFQRVGPSDRITARLYNQLAEAVEQLFGLSTAAPLVGGVGSSGVRLAIDEPDEMWAKLTGGGGADNKYSWIEQLTDDAGAWVDGPRESDLDLDPAYETTGNTGVLDPRPPGVSYIPIYYLRRGDSGVWLFTAGQCSA